MVSNERKKSSMNPLLFVTTTTKNIHNCLLKGSYVTNHSAGLNHGSGRILITVQSQESLVQSYHPTKRNRQLVDKTSFLTEEKKRIPAT